MMEQRVRVRSVYRDRRVLLTGHTGFKGGWLALWLHRLGAKVTGIALAPETRPSLFDLAGIAGTLTDIRLDIRDADALAAAVRAANPEIVFHLAAQALVRRSHDDPLGTFDTNVMGTANLLQACRGLEDLRAVICVTTDKVYENHEWVWPYRETDALGGKDPYSASKAAAELVALSYRRSYFAPRGVPVLTARGGNVIGGGDWSADRLVPDLVRAVATSEPLPIRNPDAVRPWQHVLGLCHGYLLLAERAVAGAIPGEGAWNFGPAPDEVCTVAHLLDRIGSHWTLPEIRHVAGDGKPEARLLSLDSSKARAELGWRPAMDLDAALAATAEWYRLALGGRDDMAAVTLSQIAAYEAMLGDS
ncbi:MAG: CDP-glucose 4,6-dehydratase [Pseudomonadota bacterium]|nr:CDP-glucose 4,6-dehydratase [Pseudomonadota bacterium]